MDFGKQWVRELEIPQTLNRKFYLRYLLINLEPPFFFNLKQKFLYKVHRKYTRQKCVLHYITTSVFYYISTVSYILILIQQFNIYMQALTNAK